MEKETPELPSEKSPRINDFSGNFRDILRDSMLAHTLILLIISMYVILEVRHPEDATLGISFMIVFGIALVIIGIWLVSCLRASYKKMIPRVEFKRLCMVFHLGIFETLLVGSIVYTAHSIVGALAH
ncbi:hypothetical protein [Pantoea stewartii]|uniref:Uncharacterized protein n=1 Tax=Pantoea stewartii subsp. stewartii DC283 TaxID=660596 RepID=A0ABN4YZW7_PANSE|nr:hypothetical protein [Pantoea stewartii]ARF49651.1 hypothetical protein DSJ_10070 [Pantoea stewartii subsp. stewartii DC283]KAB0545315.1 hypothetical protein F7Q90_25365 [Pantoea stewartii subsp. stewartii]